MKKEFDFSKGVRGKFYNAEIAVSATADLTAACDAFEATFATAASAQAEHVAATADTASKIREGMVAARTVEGIVQNKYADPGKLAAWLSAKHVEKDPKKKAPPTP